MDKSMLHASFNQDSTCFACGEENGFVVYNCDPPTKRFSRLSNDTTEANGIGIIEMLFRSNIFAIVGGGKNPKYPRNTLMIWDDFQSKCIAELEFRTAVTGVRLRRDLILVTIIDRAYLYRFCDLKLIKSYDTYSNSTGISAITNCEEAIIAVPGNALGTVIIDQHSKVKQHIIRAHTNNLAAITLNSVGTQLVTASDRGTLIRIWNVDTGDQLQELRRGLEVVTITSLSFDKDTTRLVVCSDKGTAHIFSLIIGTDLNRKSSLSYISSYLPTYFSSKWSSVSFEVPLGSICSFSNNSIDTVYVLTPDGKFCKYVYDTEKTTGHCIETVDIRQMNLNS